MKKLITLGIYNKNFKYILLTGIFSILTDCFFGNKLSDSFGLLKIMNNETQEKLYNHITVHEIYRYIGLFIISIIVYLYKKKNNENNNINKNKKSKNGKYSIKLIYEDEEQSQQKSVSFFTIVFTISIWIIQFYLTKLFNRSIFNDLDYWMFELIIVSYINSKMFNLKLHNHQKCAIYYNSIFCTLLKIIAIIISIILDGAEQYEIYKETPFIIPIGLIIYFFIFTIRSYSISKIKYFMDLKYISSIKILLYSSIIGIIIFSLILLIESLIECPKISDNLNLNLCLVSDNNITHNNNTNNSLYIDNLLIYFENINKCEPLDIIFEFLSTFCGIITYFFYLLFYSLILKYLTPIHYIFSNAIYTFFIQLIFIIYHKLKTGNYFDGPGDKTHIKFHHFILNVISDYLGIIGFLIYLEWIELHFCGLNYNLKFSIMKRSGEDMDQNLIENEFEESNQTDHSIIKEEGNINLKNIDI